MIPLYVYTQHHLVRPYVKGFQMNLYDHQNLRDVWIDPSWEQTSERASHDR
jgi:hypothetical protein